MQTIGRFCAGTVMPEQQWIRFSPVQTKNRKFTGAEVPQKGFPCVRRMSGRASCGKAWKALTKRFVTAGCPKNC
jgi:hypothetical protein